MVDQIAFGQSIFGKQNLTWPRNLDVVTIVLNDLCAFSHVLSPTQPLSFLPHNFFCFLIGAQPEKPRLAQPPIFSAL